MNPFKPKTTPDGALIDFLPAALEVQQRPPSPIGRAISVSIVLLFVIGIVWACVGEIDIVATATGKVIPGERVKVIQPLESGTITSIHVKDGDTVSKGQALITLDATQTQADVDRVGKELAVQQHTASRLAAFICAVKRRDCDTTESLPGTHQALLNQQIREYLSRRQSLITQKKQTKASLKNAQAIHIKLQRTLPILGERLTALETLMKKNLGARHQYLELEQEHIEMEQDHIAQQARIDELNAAISGIDNSLTTLKAETLASALNQQQDSERQIAALKQEQIKALQRAGQQKLIAPIDGTVQELVVTTLGGVVTPAQALMKIVPRDSQLEVEAMVANQDIGFVEPGQRTAVKLDAFPFTKYGLLEGTITTLSHDAKMDEELGLVYLARVALASHSVNVNGKAVNLTSGMRATVEVKTGKRKLIEYFLAPLLRYKQESIRER